ncbi:MAG TPA: hypothetical protein VHZ50_18375 [Puia sp.]|nr:hypothetical protein [Puia sp.]
MIKIFGNYFQKAAFFSAALLFLQCEHKNHHVISNSFYYWKSKFLLSQYEKSTLEQLHVKKLYIKFFDVDWNKESKKPEPLAQVNFADSSIHNYTIVPVVFITNETLFRADTNEIKILSLNISSLLSLMIRQNNLSTPSEIQMDCDWTESTKDKYFLLLHLLGLHLNETGFSSAKISATIRLYQCKYRSKTGVPPVDRGLLMCYNMGDLMKYETKNSILEFSELEKYVTSLNTYPLQLDIAFPLFEWKVLFHEHRYAGLIKGLSDSLLQNNNAIQKNDDYYIFLHDTLIDNYFFQKGDLLRSEKSDYGEIVRSCKLINDKLKSTNTTIILYHLDSLTLSKYTVNEMENIFNSLN